MKRKDERTLVVLVPDHRELARGTLKSSLRQTNLTRKEFLDLIT